jgi:hypothetical protein
LWGNDSDCVTAAARRCSFPVSGHGLQSVLVEKVVHSTTKNRGRTAGEAHVKSVSTLFHSYLVVFIDHCFLAIF